MADYYLQYSAVLMITAEETKWWEELLSLTPGERVLVEEIEKEEEELDMEASIVHEEGRSYVQFSAEENGNPGHVVLCVHKFLKQCRPEGEDEFVLTWAETCSKMREGAFCGGTAVATKRGAGFCNTYDQFNYARAEAKK